MPIEIEGEVYCTASEAARYVGIKRPTFYNNIRPHLQEYRHPGLKRPYYRQRDLEPFRLEQMRAVHPGESEEK